MSESIQFSTIKQADLTQIMAIERVIYPNPWSLKTMQSCLDAGYQCIKARTDLCPNEIAAYALMMVGFQETNLLNIGVNPEFQRRGIGAQMMHRLLLISRINQAKSMWLEVRASNQAAIGLYKKFQFRESGLRKNYYKYTNQAGEKTKEHAIMMSRKVVV